MSTSLNGVKDETTPRGKWSFDGEVTKAFDDMLERSIPQYGVMRQTCFDVGCAFVQPKTDIVDLGCSKGEAMRQFVDKYGAHNRFVGIEISNPMAEAARRAFSGYINQGIVSIREDDLRRMYPSVRASLTLAVLFIQFTPIEYRSQILRRIWQTTVDGGALVLVEKVVSETASVDDLMTKVYYDLKVANGYSLDQIQRKRMALEGVLVPLSAQENEARLKKAGFSTVECFWRWMNFAGWIAVK